jgi:hypothetical protein
MIYDTNYGNSATTNLENQLSNLVASVLCEYPFYLQYTIDHLLRSPPRRYAREPRRPCDVCRVCRDPDGGVVTRHSRVVGVRCRAVRGHDARGVYTLNLLSYVYRVHLLYAIIFSSFADSSCSWLYRSSLRLRLYALRLSSGSAVAHIQSRLSTQAVL